MKKILLAILAFVYFALSVRATAHLHDCMDIFSSFENDLHAEQKDKGPCKNDPNQCKLETQRRVVEAPYKFIRVLNDSVVPVSVFQNLQQPCYFRENTFVPQLLKTFNTTSPLVLHCVWLI